MSTAPLQAGVSGGWTGSAEKTGPPRPMPGALAPEPDESLQWAQALRCKCLLHPVVALTDHRVPGGLVLARLAGLHRHLDGSIWAWLRATHKPERLLHAPLSQLLPAPAPEDADAAG
jgi:hypothetical protein